MPIQDAAGLDFSRLDHLMGLKTSLADARLRRAFHARMKPLKLRPVDFTILVLLLANQDVTQKALCRALDVSPPGLAVILDRLQARGLLVRERSEIDRRAHQIQLTDTGRELATEAEVLSQGVDDAITAVLTPGERLLLAELLNKLVRPRGHGAGRAASEAPPEPALARAEG